ncbi:HAMP domain-containing sensor histidine kinase [Lysinibacillus fusiformis]|uniref:sensor histidine kinase n=1 Tax=Lysinibacillus fusiformis TaxID=28031 RepID=UPI002EAAF5DD|nr:HAMP domain-containing sensor histidine kinase [Lysinibacillus fusiformis]
MNKLAIRLGVTFIGAVVLSLIIGAITTYQIIPNRIFNEVHKEADQLAEYIINNSSELDENELQHLLFKFTPFKISYLTEEEVMKSPYFTKQSKIDALNDLPVDSFKKSHEVIFIYPTEDGKYLQLALKNQFIENIMKSAVIIFTIITLVIGVSLVVIASYHMAKPIKRLTIYTERLSKGEFTFPEKMKYKDEIGKLYKSFGKMAMDLEKMVKSQQSFISNISHEYQTPLTSINGFAKALRQKKLTMEKQHQYLQIIERESQRLSHLSRNVLKLSSLQNDTHVLEKSEFDVSEQIREVIISLEPQWSKKEIDFSLSIDNHKIMGDKMLLYQVWYNIINNAIYFSPEKSTITILIHSLDSDYVFLIKDQGPGISKEDIKNVKEPFYKGKNIMSKGNGLGLSIVESIVEKHKGSISLKNLSKGLSVRIQLNKK